MAILKLSRRVAERIVIGNFMQPIAVITVSDVNARGVVSLRFECPREIDVNRYEVAKSKHEAATKHAAKGATGQ